MNPKLGSAVSPRQVRVSGTNMLAVAAQYLNDATQWYRILQLNQDPTLSIMAAVNQDPWIGPVTLLKIPSPSSYSNGGISGQ